MSRFLFVSVVDSPSILSGRTIIDCSDLPLEAVAHAEKFRDPRFESELRHPDLWADWRWYG